MEKDGILILFFCFFRAEQMFCIVQQLALINRFVDIGVHAIELFKLCNNSEKNIFCLVVLFGKRRN